MLEHKSVARQIRFALFTAEDARDYEDAFPGCRVSDTEVVLTSEQFHSVKLYSSVMLPFSRDYMDKNWYPTDSSSRLRRTD